MKRAATPDNLRQALEKLQANAMKQSWGAVFRGSEPALRLVHALAEVDESSTATIERAILLLRIRAALQLSSDQRDFETSLFYGLMDLADLRLSEVLDCAPGEPPALRERLREAVRNLGRGSGVWRYSPSIHYPIIGDIYRFAFTLPELSRAAQESSDPVLWRALVEACLGAGQYAEAAAFARKGRAHSHVRPEHRSFSLLEARALDLQGEREAAARIWREIWLQASDAQGLCLLWDASEGECAAVLQAELERCYAGERALPLDLQIRMEILLGDAELPLARLQAASPARWWEEVEHPAMLVLPFLLRIGCGGAPLESRTLLHQLWRRLDNPTNRYRNHYDAQSTAWTERVDRVLAGHPTWAVDARIWRVAAGNVLMDLASEVIKAKANGQFMKVALFVVALMEANLLAGEDELQAPLVELERRHPRHSRLRQKVVEVMALSPLLRT
jgi:hypothetical protein